MARIKHTSKVHGASHAPQKQLKLIKNLKTRMKEKYGIKKMAIKKKFVGAPPASTEGEKRRHRWKPGTVAKREIRKMTRTTHLLLPKSTFSRLIREVCQEKVPHGNDIRFTINSLKAIQEASEHFMVETFHKSDLARIHAKRDTLKVEDIRFSRFMKPESMWVMPDRLHERNFFGTVPVSSTKPAKLKLLQEEAAFGKDVGAIEKKLKLKHSSSSKAAAAAAAAAVAAAAEEAGDAAAQEAPAAAATDAVEGDGRKKRKADEQGGQENKSKKVKKSKDPQSHEVPSAAAGGSEEGNVEEDENEGQAAPLSSQAVN